MNKFTLEQQRAIEYRGDKSAAVSASAGSGKTMVLVEHIAHLISDRENPVYADRLAAVTFTEKAAAELRGRLEVRISALLAESPEDDFLREQLVRLSSAKISTISSFCLSLIRDNIRLLPLEEGFAVCDDIKRRSLSDKALKKLAGYIYKKLSEKEQEEIARRLGGERKIFEAVLEMNDFLSNIPSGEDWVNEQIKIYGDPRLYAEKYIKPLTDKAGELLARLKILREKTEKILEEAQGEKSADKLKNYFSVLFEKADAALTAACSEDYAEAERALNMDVGRSPSIKSDSELYELVDIREELKEMQERCQGYVKVLKNSVGDREECLKSFELLWKLTRVYTEEYSALKRKEGVADFSDLEHYALEAVRKGGSKGDFDCIIVDEFQDSNDIQYEIFKLLSEDEKNLYFVGDAKQCIYSFRSANPEIFASLPLKENYADLSLNRNFRSVESVIATVNKMFGGENNEYIPKSFSGSRWEDMTANRTVDAAEADKSELVIINTLKGAEQGGIEREALYAAGKMRRMIDGGFIIHGKDGDRPCGYGDFAILTRTGAAGAAIRKVLEDRGIPCSAVGDKAFTSLLEAELALALLSAVLRPSDDTSVAAAMMSPVYCFTAEETAKIRLLGGNTSKDRRKKSLYGCLSEAANSDFDIALKEKAERFLADMKLFRKIAASSLSHELMSEIYSVTKLPEIMSVGRKGRERTENLRLLLHYARSIARPGDFLAVMKHIERNKLEMPQAQVKEQENKSVKLMTIHSSKGLQFPVVFLCGTNASPNKSDSYRSFIFDREKGVGISVCDYDKSVKGETAAHLLLSESCTDKVLGEELRLLYVAMTRAEEKLIVTASNTVTEKNAAAMDDGNWKTLGAEDSYLKFITSRLTINPSAFYCSLIRSSENISEEVLEQLELRDGEACSKLDTKLLKKRLDYKYPYEKAVSTPAKLTATALGINAEGIDSPTEESTVSTAFYMGLPVFMKKNRPLTPKERGDIYHKAMQFLDFNAHSAEQELGRLEEAGILTKEERTAVKVSEIQSFLDSPIARRAAASKEVFREFPVFTTVNLTGYENPEQSDLSFVQGIADMFFVEEGEIVLVDYKTNRNTSAEKLKKEYEGQLRIYKKALEEMIGLKVKGCVLFGFSLEKEIWVE